MFKAIRRLCWYFFLISLPLTLLPTIAGVLSGTIFALWARRHFLAGVDSYLHDLRDLANDWSAGEGVTSFRKFQESNNDYHLTQLKPNDWAIKMGLVRPREFQWPLGDDVGIGELLNLDGLMADVSAGRPKDQWVYVSKMRYMLFDEWDQGFAEVVQRAAVPGTKLNDTKLWFMECLNQDEFMCGIWNVRSPTLLHFQVEEDMPAPQPVDGMTYSTSLQKLRPVSMRVIEFPLDGVYTGLPPDVFHSPLEQMLAFMQNPQLVEQFEPWDYMRQMALRFDEYAEDRNFEGKGSFLYYFNEIDTWLVHHTIEPLGLEDVHELISGLSFLLTAGIMRCLVLGIYDWAAGSMKEYLGAPKRGQEIMAQPPIIGDPLAMMYGGLMEGFIDTLEKAAKDVNKQQNQEQAKAAMTPVASRRE